MMSVDKIDMVNRKLTDGVLYATLLCHTYFMTGPFLVSNSGFYFLVLFIIFNVFWFCVAD